MLTSASRVYPKCCALFDRYPLAVVAIDDVPAITSMVLMLADGADVSFFVLVRDCGAGTSAFTLSPWQAGDAVTIGSGQDDIPGLAASAVLRGVPIPRDGSLFGWARAELITALIVVYASYTPDRPVPTWAVMPRVTIPEEQWPPFTGEPVLGPWFWDHQRAGRIIDLSGAIAATTDTVFWLDTYAALGTDCCAVAGDVTSPDGHLLSRGAYLDSAALHVGTAVPALPELLADTSKTNLAPRFSAPAPCSS